MKSKQLNISAAEFPVDWHSTLIVSVQHAGADQAIEQVFQRLGVESFAISRGKVSSQGSYCAWQIRARIGDALEFRAVCTALGELPGVKMLL